MIKKVYLLSQVEEDEVVVCAAADDVISLLDELLCHVGAVRADLVCVLLEHGRVHLLERGADAGDGVLVRSALHPREHGGVDSALQVVVDRLAVLVDALLPLAVEDEPRTRPSEGLVCGGGDDVRVGEGGRVLPRRHKTPHVRHVRQQHRTHTHTHLRWC